MLPLLILLRQVPPSVWILPAPFSVNQLVALFQITYNSFTKLQINFTPTNKKNNYFWSMRKINKIVIHCTATLPSATVQNILKGWRSKGWTSNGYHWLIDRFGIATRLQGDELVSNGVKGHNSRSIHICYIGGMFKGNPIDTRTQEQKETLKMLIDEYLVKYPNSEVLGHRDLSPDLDKDGIIEPHEFVKSCPCFDVKKEYAKA